MKFRKHFDYDVEKASDEAATDPTNWGPSLTVQSMAEDADINVLMARFGLTGKMPVYDKPMMVGDFTDLPDLRTALERLGDATDRFMSYPPDLRARFQNDPVAFAEFCIDPANKAELVRLKLAPEPPPAPTPPAPAPPARPTG